eukprot:8980244-Alexandrium_andersonii.AAC.1
MSASLVGSEMCIRDSTCTSPTGAGPDPTSKHGPTARGRRTWFRRGDSRSWRQPGKHAAIFMAAAWPSGRRQPPGLRATTRSSLCLSAGS